MLVVTARVLGLLVKGYGITVTVLGKREGVLLRCRARCYNVMKRFCTSGSARGRLWVED